MSNDSFSIVIFQKACDDLKTGLDKFEVAKIGFSKIQMTFKKILNTIFYNQLQN